MTLSHWKYAAWIFCLALLAHGPAYGVPNTAENPAGNDVVEQKAPSEIDDSPDETLSDDARVQRGDLANGVKWMYRKHANPPGKIALMIHVDTGSLNETEKERGLSHFMEHMVFNGSKNFPPGELIKYFESVGLQFGVDLNAFTSLDQTVYMIFPPDTTEEMIDKSLVALSDYAFNALLLEEEIDKERGVIMAELKTHMGLEQRIRDTLWPQLFEGSRLAVRMPIGVQEVIESATREDFVHYYRTWYRPDRVTVMIVGDEEADKVIPMVEKHFGSYEAQLPPGEERGPEIKPFEKQRAIVISDPELTTARLEVYNIPASRPPLTTKAQYREELVESLGNWIINRRLEERLKAGVANYQQAGCASFGFFGEAVLSVCSVEGEGDAWEAMLEEAIVEVSRAREHGFTDRELKLVRAEYMADAERSVRQEATRNAMGILMAMVESVNSGSTLLSEETELELLKELLPHVGLEEINAAFAGIFAPEHQAFCLSLPENDSIVVPESDVVLAAARAALARKTERLETQQRADALLTEVPEPGKVIESDRDEALEITSAWLDNGVRVHHRFMDYKKDTVFISISLTGGKLEETAENLGVSDVAALAFGQPATKSLSSTEIADLMTGKNVEINASPDDDALTISVTGSPRDMETGLQLAHILMREGVIEDSAFSNWKTDMMQRLEYLKKVPDYCAMVALMDLIGSNDPRLVPLSVETVEKADLMAGQAWLERLCRTAPIEVAVVGEMKLEEAMPLIETYIGSLPKRPRTLAGIESMKKIDFLKGPKDNRIPVDTITPNAMVLHGFRGNDPANMTESRILNLASFILSSRLIQEVREEKQLVYSIQASNMLNYAFKGMGHLFSIAPCAPDKAEGVATESKAIFTSFAEKGPSSEELESAKKQILNMLDTQLKEPTFWWSTLQHLNLRDRNLADFRGIEEAYKAITVEQVAETFKRYYKPDRIFTITAEPAPKKEIIGNNLGSDQPKNSLSKDLQQNQ